MRCFRIAPFVVGVLFVMTSLSLGPAIKAHAQGVGDVRDRSLSSSIGMKANPAKKQEGAFGGVRVVEPDKAVIPEGVEIQVPWTSSTPPGVEEAKPSLATSSDKSAPPCETGSLMPRQPPHRKDLKDRRRQIGLSHRQSSVRLPTIPRASKTQEPLGMKKAPLRHRGAVWDVKPEGLTTCMPKVKVKEEI